MAWLKDGDLNDWVEVVNNAGQLLGWITGRECHNLGIPLQIIETPKLYLTSPILRHHALIAKERGVLQNGNDISEVQNVLLLANYMRDQEDAEKLRVRRFEESLWTTNQDLWKAYQKYKEEQALADMGQDVEERIPQDVSEFLSALRAFSEEEAEQEDKPEGWLASILDDEALNEMED